MPMVPSNWNLLPQAPWLLQVVQYPLVQILAACLPSLHSFAPTGSTAFSQCYVTSLAAQTNHGKCLPKATKCFWLSKKLSVQSIQVTCIESNGVTAFAPQYGFPSFFNSFYSGKQLLIFQKVFLWQPINSSCQEFLQRRWIHQQPILNCCICKVGC